MVLPGKESVLLRCLVLPILLGALYWADVAYAADEPTTQPGVEVSAEGGDSSLPKGDIGIVEDALEPMLGIIEEPLDPMRGDGQSSFDKGWNYIDGAWYWCAEVNAAPSNGWVWIDSDLYWFDPERAGRMVTGMFEVEGNLYITNDSGRVHRGYWVDFEGNWYYATSSGALAKGWLQLNGKWYWLDPATGVMQTGWLQLDDGKYWLDSSGAMVTGWKKLDGSAYKFDQQGRLVEDTGSVLNVSRNRLVEWLWSHESDGYYIGTPYSFGFSIPTCTYPNGAPRWDGYTGMNCTGMVAHAYSMVGGVGDLGAIGSTNSHSPWLGGPGGGSYINAWRWYGYAIEHGAEMYVFDDVDSMLASGKADKGDIIFFRTNGSIDCHIGFFWGDTPYENKMWHQIYPRNLISTCFNNANKNELYQDTVLIKGC